MEEKRQKNPSQLFDTITNEIFQLLTKEALSTSSLVSAIFTGSEKDKVETIRILLDAGKIKFSGDKLDLK